ncbi:signal peptidase I [Bdellovibrio bacteriovorus]|uniref:Signal peptidase I n=1 Tax=Bdellovibrio bacteriovorus TaxID=959 RepID=A0A150WIN7_BDEBC|nr:signal peptidase I [Bdellovibrio bacteriovorus]KYG63496.1 signal peptidase I [Bdellovibrio bacteriovorus]
MNRWREYLTTLILAVVCALVVRNFLVTAYKVPTGSMQPTLKPGDFIFSSRISYGFPIPFSQQRWGATLPERGDLVVFNYPNQPGVTYVKRVVGLPGDRVQIVKGRLVLNDEALKYEKAQEVPGDNPNPELFDIYEEITPEKTWKVIFQKQPEEKDFGPLVVPPGEVFLLGDNRDASDDSRYWGTVPMPQVIGRVVFIWLSLDWQRKWGGDRYPSVRWQRVFSTVY